MSNKVQFLGFKRVSQSVFDAVTPQKREQYLWFVKPDGDLINETGDIYLGSFHYGHYGHADADNIQELWDTLGTMFSTETGHTVTDYVQAIQESISDIQESLGDGFVDESGNPITFTEAIQNNTELIQEVDNEWRRVVGEGVVDGAIEVDGEKFFEGATVTNVISANTIALLIEIDEPINVTQEQLDDMAASGGTASGLSTLLGDYSEVTLPENGNVDLDNNIIVGE